MTKQLPPSFGQSNAAGSRMAGYMSNRESGMSVLGAVGRGGNRKQGSDKRERDKNASWDQRDPNTKLIP